VAEDDDIEAASQPALARETIERALDVFRCLPVARWFRFRLDPFMRDFVTEWDNLDVGQQYQTLSNHRADSVESLP
jgi:hypothetical protein